MNAAEPSTKRRKVSPATVEGVEALCSSPELTLDALREKIGSFPPDIDVPNPSFLHRACMNEKITLEIVEYLLGIYPNAANEINAASFGRWETSAYPLHIACHNVSCPASIIALLMRENPSALREMCVVDGGIFIEFGVEESMPGLPLHYYVSREINRDFDTVRTLVEEYPESLMVQDPNNSPSPVHCLVDNPCPGNPSLDVDIIRYFFEVNSQCFRLVDGYQRLPIHYALFHGGKKVKPEVAHALLDCWPESVSQRDGNGELPIHILSDLATFDEGSLMELLTRILTYDPESASERDPDGRRIPIHIAASGRSLAFCKMIVDAFPESVSMMSEGDMLPIHHACSCALGTVKYLFDLYPEAIHAKESPPPSGYGRTPLEIAKEQGESTESIAAFLEAQLKYVNLADDVEALATKDRNGWLPLHQALRDNVSIGTVILLVRGYPAALESPGIMKIAYEYSSLDVVQLLVQLTGSRLDDLDSDMNTPLHLACRGRHMDVVKYFVEECPSLVSKRNANKRLPIHLLWESDAEVDNGSTSYVEVVWLMLLAHPEVLMGESSDTRAGNPNCEYEHCCISVRL